MVLAAPDDQVYVGTYSLDHYSDDYYDGLTLIYVQLGTGEVLAKAIPAKGIYKVHFAKLLSDFGGNQIVLEITNRGSTYAASNIFVISAYVEERSTGGTDGEIKKIPEILFLLNTMGYGYPTGGTSGTREYVPTAFRWDWRSLILKGWSNRDYKYAILHRRRLLVKRILRQGRSTGIAVFGGSASRS